jgi:hypothetical protein
MALSASWRLRRWAAFLVLLSLAGLIGCSSGTGKVSGKVDYNGKLLKGGDITFISTTGKPSRSTRINENGSYSVSDVPAGKVKICVDTSTLNPAGKTVRAPHYKPPAGQKAPGGLDTDKSEDMAKRYMWIPTKYAKSDETDLTLDVKRGDNEHDIHLK